MPWIETIAYAEAGGRLRQLYERIKGPGDVIDDIMMAHSLRPHSMEGHMALYKAALHHGANRVPKWFLETLGVWVSGLNSCAYCVAHHSAGLARLLGDDARHASIVGALYSGEIETGPFTEGEKRALRYAEALTRDPAAVTETMLSDPAHSEPPTVQPLETGSTLRAVVERVADVHRARVPDIGTA